MLEFCRRLAKAALFLAVMPVAQAGHGLILDQQLDAYGRGYTVIRVWGSYYQMGYAQAELLGDCIVQGINQTKAFLGSYNYSLARAIMAGAVWMPPEIEDEFDGMVDCLAISHPQQNIDKLDLKVACTAVSYTHLTLPTIYSV